LIYALLLSASGLGLAYAGSNRDDVLSLLLPVLSHPKSSMEVVGVAALACGLVAVASCNGDVTSALLQTLMEKSEVELKDTFSRFLPLGLGLTYLGKQEAVEAVVLALEVLAEPFKVCIQNHVSSVTVGPLELNYNLNCLIFFAVDGKHHGGSVRLCWHWQCFAHSASAPHLQRAPRSS
jgi:hypothetical protein